MALVVAKDFFRARSVLVTGGTGFIGRRLVAVLQGLGARVRILARSTTGLSSDWSGVEISVGDLTDAVSLARASVGIDAIIHAAAFAHAGAASDAGLAARHWTVNAEGTFRLLDAAVAARVRRFVFLSSVKAVGEPGPRCVDERWDALPETPYGRAKRAAEARVLAVGREAQLHAVNLRPVLVYGPGMKANLARWIDGVRRGWCPPLPETGNRRSLVHVDDVAQAAVLAVAHPAARHQTYLITDGRPYSGRELYLTIRQALRRPTSDWAVPPAVLYAAATLADGALRLSGRRNRPAHAALDKLLGWACYDSTRLERELGYRPSWTFQRYCAAELSEWGQP